MGSVPELIFLSEIRSVSISATQIQPYTMYTHRPSDINLPSTANLNQTAGTQRCLT